MQRIKSKDLADLYLRDSYGTQDSRKLFHWPMSLFGKEILFRYEGNTETTTRQYRRELMANIDEKN